MSTRRPSILRRIRQNHALEHATIHLLARHRPMPRVVARSDWNGFTIYGNVETSQVADAAREGLLRLQAGEKDLAVHPRCGTNIVVGGLAAVAASSLTLMGKDRSRMRRILSFAAAAFAGLVLAYPLGPVFQQYVTTSSNLTGMRIEEVRREQRGNTVMHRVRVGWD
jgi:hypothetical protein